MLLGNYSNSYKQETFTICVFYFIRQGDSFPQVIILFEATFFLSLFLTKKGICNITHNSYKHLLHSKRYYPVLTIIISSFQIKNNFKAAMSVKLFIHFDIKILHYNGISLHMQCSFYIQPSKYFQADNL